MLGCIVAGCTLKGEDASLELGGSLYQPEMGMLGWSLRCIPAAACIESKAFSSWANLFCGDSMVLQHFDEDERVCEPLQLEQPHVPMRFDAACSLHALLAGSSM